MLNLLDWRSKPNNYDFLLTDIQHMTLTQVKQKQAQALIKMPRAQQIEYTKDRQKLRQIKLTGHYGTAYTDCIEETTQEHGDFIHNIGLQHVLYPLKEHSVHDTSWN